MSRAKITRRDMSSAPAYLRAARRKHADPEAIFQAALEGLEPKQLARLVDALRDSHPGWKLRKRQRDPLIDAMVEDGISNTKIADWLGCHVKTVRRRAEVREATPVDRMNKRGKVDKTASRVSLPILSFHAAGGGDDERLILRLLDGGQR